jgi:hypothetical protein
MVDSDNDQPMRTPPTNTPPTNSPPSSGDERSPPATPQMRSRSILTLPELAPGVMMQVNDILADNQTDGAEHVGKKKREEREMMMATQAEKDKLLDMDWREGAAS